MYFKYFLFSKGLLTLCLAYLLQSINAIENGISPQDHHSRSKRFIVFNTQSPVAIGALITLPMTFAIPTYNLHSSRRLRRSGETYLFDNETIVDSYDDPAYSVELSDISSYFNIMEVQEDICHRRLLCEIFSSPEKFKPLSDILLKKLSVDRGLVVEKEENRYFRFIRAMQDGMGGKCKTKYANCPYSVEEIINMPVLQFWGLLSSYLNIEFKDL